MQSFGSVADKHSDPPPLRANSTGSPTSSRTRCSHSCSLSVGTRSNRDGWYMKTTGALLLPAFGSVMVAALHSCQSESSAQIWPLPQFDHDAERSNTSRSNPYVF